MPDWTKAQQAAIDVRGSNILVSAAAGSGKTAVLVERVVRMITDARAPVPLDRLLVVTFTNAAAAEMKARISKALTDIIKINPNSTNALRQLSLLPSAQICTIDSFCMNLVREHFFHLGISQDFTILDPSQLALLEQSTAEELVDELYREDEEEFRALVELLSTSKNDAALIDSVLRVHSFISSQPYPQEWLKSAGALYDPAVCMDDSPLKSTVVTEIRELLHMLSQVVVYLTGLLVPDDEMYDAYSDMLKEDAALLSTLENSLDLPWDRMRDIFLNAAFSGVPRAKRGFDAPYKQRLLDLRKLYTGKSDTNVIYKRVLPLLAVSDEDIKKDNAYLQGIYQSLSALVAQFDAALLEKKRELNAYSFSDIEHFAIQLLFYPDGEGGYCRTELAAELSAQYAEILVDEYQDTNTAQDLLFEMLSNGQNRFMVGDVKQSIYRFRLAMPSIFTAKKNAFIPYTFGDAPNRKIILDKNFRSRQGICDYTNFLFSHLMSERVGELDYGPEDYLHCGAVYPPSDIPSAQLKLIEIPEGEEADEAEAHRAAQLILHKINTHEQVRQGEGTRDLAFGDIAILFRSAKKAMPVYTKVFREYGIPVVANNRVNLFDNNEVAILLSLLRVVDNPMQDVPLLATLMSVFYGYSADDIAHARVVYPSRNLYSSIAADPAFERLMTDLDTYRRYAASMSVEHFLRSIISDSSYLSLMAAMGNFEQRKQNVMKLLELAKTYDAGESVGLTAFIRYIDRLTESKLEIDSAEVAASEENCVRLMSVHKSKGLEFPVVILAGSAHKYNMLDSRRDLLMNYDLGIGMKVHDEAHLCKYDSLPMTVMKNMNSRAMMSENLRVLYVAITRAKEQFIALVSDRDVARRVARAADRIIGCDIPAYFVEKMSNDADLLLTCALLHPASDALKRECEVNLPSLPAFSFPFSVEILNDASFRPEQEEERAIPDEATVRAIRENLAYTYERAALSSYASKRTASSLDEKEQNYQYFATKKPTFLSGGLLTGAQKGTAMHTFMQFCDYTAAKEHLEGEIQRLKEGGFLTEIQAASLHREKLKTLFASDFAQRMFESGKIYREIKVSSFVPLCELEDTEATDLVLVQGIADCVFEEDGALVLVDYKTDTVSGEEELLSLYRKQIMFYRAAIERTLGKPVKEAMLYSFSLNRVCKY